MQEEEKEGGEERGHHCQLPGSSFYLVLGTNINLQGVAHHNCILRALVEITTARDKEWRRKWQPTPVLLPGESQGRRSLVGCRLWGRTESDMTEAT